MKRTELLAQTRAEQGCRSLGWVLFRINANWSVSPSPRRVNEADLPLTFRMILSSNEESAKGQESERGGINARSRLVVHELNSNLSDTSSGSSSSQNFDDLGQLNLLFSVPIQRYSGQYENSDPKWSGASKRVPVDPEIRAALLPPGTVLIAVLQRLLRPNCFPAEFAQSRNSPPFDAMGRRRLAGRRRAGRPESLRERELTL